MARSLGRRRNSLGLRGLPIWRRACATRVPRVLMKSLALLNGAIRKTIKNFISKERGARTGKHCFLKVNEKGKTHVHSCKEQGRGDVQGPHWFPQVVLDRPHFDGFLHHLHADVSEGRLLRSSDDGSRLHQRRLGRNGVLLRHRCSYLLPAFGYHRRQVPYAHSRVGRLHRHRSAHVPLRNASFRADVLRAVRRHGSYLHPDLVGHPFQGYSSVLRRG